MPAADGCFDHDYFLGQLHVAPLTPSIGAMVSGLDLRAAANDDEVREAVRRHKVVFFRAQDLSTLDFVAFGRRFGTLQRYGADPAGPGASGSGTDPAHPEIRVFEYDASRRGRENFWHFDVMPDRRPARGAILRARVVPAVGGDTLFCDMYAAYEGLSDRIRRSLDGLRAVHDFTRTFGRLMSAEELAKKQQEFPPAEHPVVRTHPETGRKGLYVNAAFTSHIVGLEPTESDRLLELLYRQATVPEYQCRFRWRRHSVAFWDNRAVQHYAASDYFPSPRLMERVTIVGDRPI